ncbi:apolipoprotein N-acyltransferase [Chlamydia pecorum]|uniref:apolipoprotein N-acyltransferase n=1 Tax=Chlamydia pecorum TaxID=85991 RepID=UPI0003ADEBAE|nr:apolipoprotein N-acyltransferase [Chlamydia pecorum]AGW39442.1 apolipoprotein N-acyltransferase [Chlamydia pecorum P787]
MNRVFGFVISWILMACAQPDLSKTCCLLGLSCGYGLLWYSLEPLRGARLSWKVLRAMLFIWALSVEGVHFSWMLSDIYVGKFIYAVWAMLIGILALIFTCFSCILIALVRKGRFSLLWCLPGLWVALEILRFYGLCSGMSLDYLGLPMTACAYGRQFGGFFGWAGQSFSLIAIGISFYCLLLKRKYAAHYWLVALGLPLCLGGIHYEYLKRRSSEETKQFHVAVIQPATSPEGPWNRSPMHIWHQLIQLSLKVKHPIDLLIFPEVAVPFDGNRQIYAYEESLPILAPLHLPEKKEFLTNFDWANSLSHYFQCPVLIGMERWEEHSGKYYFYNAAELVTQEENQRYDKRVLVPGGEYIPGGKLGIWICKKFFPEYALSCIRVPGKRSGVLRVSGAPTLGVSICYEETFGYLLRNYKKQGAQLLINLTNDGWYPNSRLPQVHFSHGILRNQELGMPCVRACQTGVTVAADALGRVIKQLPYETRKKKASPGVLQVSVPLFTYPTLYTYCGDWVMLSIALCLSGYLGFRVFGYRLLAKKEKG